MLISDELGYVQFDKAAATWMLQLLPVAGMRVLRQRGPTLRRLALRWLRATAIGDELRRPLRPT